MRTPIFSISFGGGTLYCPSTSPQGRFLTEFMSRARSLSDAECQVWHYFPTRTTTDINRREKKTTGLFLLLLQHPYRHSRRTLQEMKLHLLCKNLQNSQTIVVHQFNAAESKLRICYNSGCDYNSGYAELRLEKLRYHTNYTHWHLILISFKW